MRTAKSQVFALHLSVDLRGCARDASSLKGVLHQGIPPPRALACLPPKMAGVNVHSIGFETSRVACRVWGPVSTRQYRRPPNVAGLIAPSLSTDLSDCILSHIVMPCKPFVRGFDQLVHVCTKVLNDLDEAQALVPPISALKAIEDALDPGAFVHTTFASLCEAAAEIASSRLKKLTRVNKVLLSSLVQSEEYALHLVPRACLSRKSLIWKGLITPCTRGVHDMTNMDKDFQHQTCTRLTRQLAVMQVIETSSSC